MNSAIDDVTPGPFDDEATARNGQYYGYGPIGSGALDIHVSMQPDDESYGPGVPVTELNTSTLGR